MVQHADSIVENGELSRACCPFLIQPVVGMLSTIYKINHSYQAATFSLGFVLIGVSIVMREPLGVSIGLASRFDTGVTRMDAGKSGQRDNG